MVDKKLKLGNILGSQEGASLVIALGVTTLLVIMALGVNKALISSLRGAGKIEGASAAYFTAEAGLEEALYDIAVHDSGYEVDPLIHGTYSEVNFDQNASRAAWKIKSLPAANPPGSNIYIIPEPGEGNASNKDYNIINLSNPLSLSLFVDIALPGSLASNLQKVTPNTFDLYLQIPDGFRNDLANLEVDNDGDGLFEEDDLPYTVDNDGDSLIDEDPINDAVVNWSVTGVDSSGGQLILRPVFISPAEITEREIHKNMITALFEENTGGEYKSSLTGAFIPKSFRDFVGSVVENPVFKVSVIANLLDSSQNKIPYLEYKIVYRVNSGSLPIPNPQMQIISDGFAGNFKQSVEAKIKIKE